MNITYLFGNGFDLQQHLKTRYVDFMKWYRKKQPNDFFSRKCTEDNESLWLDFELYMGRATKHLHDKIEMNDYLNSVENVKMGLKEYMREQKNSVRYKYDNISKTFKDSIRSFNKGKFLFPVDEVLRRYNFPNGEHKINFIEFNYTGIATRLFYKVKRKNIYFYKKEGKNKVKYKLCDSIQVHGNTRRHVVFGVDNETQISNRNIDRHLRNCIIKQEMLDELYPSRRRKSMQKINDSDIIVIFGCSLGGTDATYWNEIKNWLTDTRKKLIVFFHRNSIVTSNSEEIAQCDIMQCRELLEDVFSANNEQVKFYINSSIFDFSKKAKYTQL